MAAHTPIAHCSRGIILPSQRPEAFACGVAERLLRETGMGRAGLWAVGNMVRGDPQASLALVRKDVANQSAQESDEVRLLALAFVAAAKAGLV